MYIYQHTNETKTSSSSSSSSSSSDSSDDGERVPYNPIADALDALIDSVADYDDPAELWDHVRQWLRARDPAETRAAVEYKGEFDTTALHVACRNHPPVDVVEVMLRAAPDMIFWADSFGWLPVRFRCIPLRTFRRIYSFRRGVSPHRSSRLPFPPPPAKQLHYACANGTDMAVTELLVAAFPDGRLNTDKRGRTPLHFALGNAERPASPSLVRLLAGEGGRSARWPDENAMLPIHYACAYGASVEVLNALIDSWDRSLRETDSRGRTPLHFMMGNADRANSPKVVELLLGLHPGAMEQLDAEGNLPLNLLSTKARTIQDGQVEERRTMSRCLGAYLHAKPRASSEFLVGVQNMPEWLRDVAVITPTVQKILNSKISSRFPTMILLLDFYFLAATIAAFSFTSRESIDRRFNPLNDTLESRSVSVALLSPLYVGALYFLGREVTQMISVRNQTTIFAYLADSENLVNASFIFLTVYYTILMQTGWGDNERFRIGCAFTIGACYLQVLVYLKDILIEFAIFVSGVVYVSSRLTAFVVSLMITIAAFSQMWHTLFQQSSECLGRTDTEVVMNGTTPPPTTAADDYFYYDDALFVEAPVQECEPQKDYPYCDGLWWSFLKTYTMFLGEYDDTLFSWDPMSLLLFLAFYCFEVIVLVNILIAIITDLYAVVTNERAAIVFWSNRLAFLTDMDMITNGPWKKTIMDLFKMRGRSGGEEEASLIRMDKVDISWERILWKKLIECFDPGVEDGMGMVLYAPLRIFVSMFLIPFWLLMGILSAGWLWPPQIREGLFVQKVSVEDTHGELNEIQKRVEEVETLMNNLNTLKEGFFRETNTDRKDMIRLKNQVRSIKKELKNEMKKIKGVMTSLFEVQQQVMSR